VKLAKLANNSFERKNVTFWGSKRTQTAPTCFLGIKTKPPGSTVTPDYCNVTIRNASMLCVRQHLACVDLSNVL